MWVFKSNDARIGLPAASTELAIRRDGDESVRFGVISKKMLSPSATCSIARVIVTQRSP